MPEKIKCPKDGLDCVGVPRCPHDEITDCEVKDPPIGKDKVDE